MIRTCSALLELELEGQTEPFFEFSSTFNIAQIDGGEAINVVPDKAEAFIDIHLLPSQQAQSIVQTNSEVPASLAITPSSVGTNPLVPKEIDCLLCLSVLGNKVRH